MNKREKNNFASMGPDSSQTLGAALLNMLSAGQSNDQQNATVEDTMFKMPDGVAALIKEHADKIMEIAEQHDLQFMMGITHGIVKTSAGVRDEVILSYHHSDTANSNALKGAMEIVTKTGRFAEGSFGEYYVQATATDEEGECDCPKCQARRENAGTEDATIAE